MIPFYIQVVLGCIIWLMAISFVIAAFMGRIPTGNNQQRTACLLSWLIMAVLSGMKLMSLLQGASNREVAKYTLIGYLLGIPLAFIIGTSPVSLAPMWSHFFSRWTRSEEGVWSISNVIIHLLILPAIYGFMGYSFLIGSALIGEQFVR